MKLYTARLEEQEMVLVSFDGGKKAWKLEDLGFAFEDMNALILAAAKDKELMGKIKAEGEARGEAPLEIAAQKLLAPIVRPRQDIICLGVNYSDHAVEADRFNKESFYKDKPFTIYFSKRVSRAAGPDENVPSYQGYVDSLDYEAELAVIISEDILGVSVEEAEKYIFGYTVLNDISSRNLQTRHKQWYLGKSLDGHTPIGPCIVTPDEIGDPKKLDIKSRVNGEIRQNSNTSLMITTVAEAIADLNQAMTLQAGSIITTGTPAGVGMGMIPPCFLKPGDVVECEIENIGILRNPIA